MAVVNDTACAIKFEPLPKKSSFKDLTGLVFGRLTVTGYAGPDRRKACILHLWYCRCECGRLTKVYATNIKNGYTKSCGCIRDEKIIKQSITHGKYHTPERRCYNKAKERCQNPKCKNYGDYGGRGILFLFSSLDQFINHIGTRPSNTHSLDRINVNGHYEIGNVRWATLDQQQNNKRNTRWITINGTTKSLYHWCPEKTGKQRSSIYRRIVKYKWCPSCAIETPGYTVNPPKCPHAY